MTSSHGETMGRPRPRCQAPAVLPALTLRAVPARASPFLSRPGTLFSNAPWGAAGRAVRLGESLTLLAGVGGPWPSWASPVPVASTGLRGPREPSLKTARLDGHLSTGEELNNSFLVFSFSPSSSPPPWGDPGSLPRPAWWSSSAGGHRLERAPTLLRPPEAELRINKSRPHVVRSLAFG